MSQNTSTKIKLSDEGVLVHDNESNEPKLVKFDELVTVEDFLEFLKSTQQPDKDEWYNLVIVEDNDDFDGKWKNTYLFFHGCLHTAILKAFQQKPKLLTEQFDYNAETFPDITKSLLKEETLTLEELKRELFENVVADFEDDYSGIWFCKTPKPKLL